MADEETPTAKRIMELKGRVAHLEAELDETRARKTELLEQNQALRRQVDKIRLDLMDADATEGMEQELREEVARLSAQVAEMKPLYADIAQLRELWRRDSHKLFLAEQREVDTKRLMRRLYDIAAWTASCTPDTLAETFGEASADLKQAEALLQEE